MFAGWLRQKFSCALLVDSAETYTWRINQRPTISGLLFELTRGACLSIALLIVIVIVIVIVIFIAIPIDFAILFGAGRLSTGSGRSGGDTSGRGGRHSRARRARRLYCCHRWLGGKFWFATVCVRSCTSSTGAARLRLGPYVLPVILGSGTSCGT